MEIGREVAISYTISKNVASTVVLFCHLGNIHSIARDWLLYPSLTAKPGGVALWEAEAECLMRQ